MNHIVLALKVTGPWPSRDCRSCLSAPGGQETRWRTYDVVAVAPPVARAVDGDTCTLERERKGRRRVLDLVVRGWVLHVGNERVIEDGPVSGVLEDRRVCRLVHTGSRHLRAADNGQRTTVSI